MDAAVIGGRDRWACRLQVRQREFLAQLRDREREDQTHRARLEQRVEQLKRLEHFALPLIDALASLPSRERWEFGLALDRARADGPAAARIGAGGPERT